MRLLDLTHSSTRQTPDGESVPVLVRSVTTVDQIPLERLVTLATVLDLTVESAGGQIRLEHVRGSGVADIGGCILRTCWCDRHMQGSGAKAPRLDIDAAAYLLEGGVRTVTADFPLADEAADLLLHNNCVLVHCLSGLDQLQRRIVRLVALPIKLRDTYSAEARVIAIEEEQGASGETDQFFA